MPSIMSADCLFSVFFPLPKRVRYLLSQGVNIFVGTKILIYIGLSKYSSHLLHQNMMFMVDVV